LDRNASNKIARYLYTFSVVLVLCWFLFYYRPSTCRDTLTAGAGASSVQLATPSAAS